jgi:hypothetical protein
MSPVLETTLAITTACDASNEGSVVSFGPEEDAEMLEANSPGTVKEAEMREPVAGNESTYLLIHSDSFSFGLGDLRLWLRHLSTVIDPSSISGIYRPIQPDYRVDYFFKVRNSGDAELLLRAGESNFRSSGARYMGCDSFQCATMELRRSGLDASPPPESIGKEKPKLPTFKRTVPPRTPPEEH